MRLAVLALVALAVAATGCRKSVVPSCRAKCTCSPCTDADLDTCIDQASAEQHAAEEKGCLDQFDTFVDCFEDTFSCKSGTFQCGHAEGALAVCAGNGNPFADICERSATKVSTCIPGAMQMPNEPCTGINACQAQCIVDATCEQLNGKDPGGSLSDCISVCAGVPPPTP